MNFKFDQTYQYLQTRQNLFSPTHLNMCASMPKDGYQYINSNWTLVSDDDMIKLDVSLTQFTKQIKQTIEKYIQNPSQSYQQLLKYLKCLLKLAKRLEFYHVVMKMNNLFQGVYGLFALYRYAESLQILKLVFEIQKIIISDNELSKHSQIKSYLQYKNSLQITLDKFSISFLSRIEQQMYQECLTWPIFSWDKSNFQTDSDLSFQENLQKAFEEKKNTFKQSQASQIHFIVLIQYQMRQISQICHYLSLLKLHLLDKKTGIMTGQYQLWNRVYKISTKIYAGNAQSRKNSLIEVDQIMSNSTSIPQFTQFLFKNYLECNVSLSSMNFFFKNASATQKKSLKFIYEEKIRKIISDDKLWKNGEDISEYVENQADQIFKEQIANNIQKKILGLITNEISFEQNELYDYQFSLSFLIQLISKNKGSIKNMFETKIVQKVKAKIQKKTNYRTIRLIHQIIMTYLEYCFEQLDDLESYFEENLQLVQNIFAVFQSFNQCDINVNRIALKIFTYFIVEDKISDVNGANKKTYWESVANLIFATNHTDELDLDIFPNEEQFKKDTLKLVLLIIDRLSISQLAQRQEMKKIFNKSEEYPLSFLKSYLSFRAFKNKVLFKGLQSACLHLSSILPFEQTMGMAFEYYQPIVYCGTWQPNNRTFDQLDALTQQFPIETLKFIYRRIKHRVNIDCKIFAKFDVDFWNEYWQESNGRLPFITSLLKQREMKMVHYDYLHQLRKMQGIFNLMLSVFDKLNEKSQRTIKQIKQIYLLGAETGKILYGQYIQFLFHDCVDYYQKLSQSFALRQKEKHYDTIQERKFITNQFVLAQQNELENPFFTHNFLTKYKGIKTIFDYFRIGQIIESDYFDTALISVSIFSEFKKANEQVNPKKYIYQCLIELFMKLELTWGTFFMIEDRQKANSSINQSNLINETINQIENLSRAVKQHPEQREDPYVQKMLTQLESQLSSAFLPKIISFHLNCHIQQHKDKRTRQDSNAIVQKQFALYLSCLKLIEVLVPDSQDHFILIMQLLQQSFYNNKTIINLQLDFIVRYFELFLKCIFEGIRVRSYHLYRLVKKYSEIEANSQPFFNSIILHYIGVLFQEFIDEYTAPSSFQILGKYQLSEIDQILLQKEKSILSYQPKFRTAQCSCILSMFMNLFFRINFKSLAEGVNIMFTEIKDKKIFLNYLIQLTKKLSNTTEDKIMKREKQILNVDVYGNIPIILKNCHDPQVIACLAQLTKAMFHVKINLNGINTLPLKLITEEVMNFSTSIDLEQFQEYEDAILLSILNHSKKFKKGIQSNLHLCNLNYIQGNSINNIVKLLELNQKLIVDALNREDFRKLRKICEHSNCLPSSEELTVKISQPAMDLFEQLLNKFYEHYFQSETENELAKKCYIFFKIIVTSVINHPELFILLKKSAIKHQNQHFSFISLIIRSLRHTSILFMEYFALILKINSGFTKIVYKNCQTTLPNCLLEQIDCKVQLLQLLRNDKIKELKYLPQAINFSVGSPQQHRMKTYRFIKIFAPYYQQIVNQFDLWYHKQVFNQLKQHIKQQISKQDMFCWLQIGKIFMNKMLPVKDLQNFKISIYNKVDLILKNMSQLLTPIHEEQYGNQKIINLQQPSPKKSTKSNPFNQWKIKDVDYSLKIQQNNIKGQSIHFISDIVSSYDWQLLGQQSEKKSTYNTQVYCSFMNYLDKFHDFQPQGKELANSETTYDDCFDGICQEESEDDGIIQDDQDGVIQQCCDSDSGFEGSIQMISEKHAQSLKELKPRQQQDNTEVTKQHLLYLIEQYPLNPQVIKQIISMIPSAKSPVLQKLCTLVDGQIKHLLQNQLQSRGFYNFQTEKIQCKNMLNNSIILQNIVNKIEQSHHKPIQQLNQIPKLSQKTLLSLILQFCCSQIGELKFEKQVYFSCISKFIFEFDNLMIFLQWCLYILTTSQTNFNLLASENNCNKIVNTNVKKIIINELMYLMIEQKIGMDLIFKCHWNLQHKFIKQFKEYALVDLPSTEKCENNQPIIQIIIKILLQDNFTLDTNQKFMKSLEEYIKFGYDVISVRNLKNHYIYQEYQQSQSFPIELAEKFSQKLRKNWKSITQMPNLKRIMQIIFCLDPKVLMQFFQIQMSKICQFLQNITNKELGILQLFKNSFKSLFEAKQLLKATEAYWCLRKQKRADKYQQQLQYTTKLLSDLAIHVIPNFKIHRLHFYHSQNIEKFEKNIDKIRQEILRCPTIQQKLKLKEILNVAEVQYASWKYKELNDITNQQIFTLIESHASNLSMQFDRNYDFFMELLSLFGKNQQSLMSIYAVSSSFYKMMLCLQIIVKQESHTYHSMASLKTKPSLHSINNLSHERRRSSFKSSGRLSIHIPLTGPNLQHCLKKISMQCNIFTPFLEKNIDLLKIHAQFGCPKSRLQLLHLKNNTLDKQIQCTRENIWNDTLPHLNNQFVNSNIKIKIKGEIGIDYGGISRQWVTLIVKELMNPNLGLFQLSVNKLSFQPSKNAFLIPNYLTHFEKFGMLVGKALQENWLLQINFTKSFLKHLLGKTLYVQDLEDIDPDTCKSLLWILNNEIDEDLGITFSYEKNIFDKKVIVQLIEDGSNVLVNDQNKKDYVKRLAKAKMTQQIRDQSKAFMKGVEKIIPYDILSLFTYQEMAINLAGMPVIDVAEMKAYAKYQNYDISNKNIEWFWEILQSWSETEKANFLFFLTGSYKVGFGGFKQYPITINKMAGCLNFLPVSHTCFSILDLPEYSCMQKMGKQLKKAVDEGKGFSVS